MKSSNDITPARQFTLTIDVTSDRDADETVALFQKFFDFYHPSLKAVVRKQVTEKKAESEDLL